MICELLRLSRISELNNKKVCLNPFQVRHFNVIVSITKYLSAMASVGISKVETNYHPFHTPESVENTFKAAYSHGLETIYALETVDIKTVRLIQNRKPEVRKKSLKVWQKEIGIFNDQFEFDFGEHHRTWITPLILREPIQVLELTKRAEGCLIANGKMFLADLIGRDIQQFVFLKGMGQGHIDEIHSKLNAYSADRSLTRSYHIEFISWLLSLTEGIDRKKSAIYLNEIGCSNLHPLSPAEKFELSRIDQATKKAWANDVIAELRKNERIAQVHQDVKRITLAFIMPWLRSRFGIATENEITERLYALSDDPQKANNAIKLLKNVYYHEQFPLNEYLYQVDPKVFCSNEKEALAYQEIVQGALSYFYKPSVFYSLPQLTNLILRDFAKAWKNYSEGFIVAVLRKAPCFRVRRGFSGHLEVRLGFHPREEKNIP